MAPASKHQREASGSGGSYIDADAAKASKLAKRDKFSSHALSLATFADLPEELRSRILNLACYRQEKNEHVDDSTIDSKWRVRLDLPTVAKLALVSRHFHSVYHPTLWAHVKLTRPSELAAFHKALAVEPKNGGLVKSLQLGHLADLPEGWWPLRWEVEEDDPRAEPMPLLRTSITTHDEALRRLPRWCRPGQEWEYELCLPGCEHGHVAAAVRQAFSAVNVEPDMDLGFIDEKDKVIGINEWTKRLFYTQAVLDLYLCEMRRIDDAGNRRTPAYNSEQEAIHKELRACRQGKCGHYPDLVLEGFDVCTGSAADHRASTKGSKQGAAGSADQSQGDHAGSGGAGGGKAGGSEDDGNESGLPKRAVNDKPANAKKKKNEMKRQKHVVVTRHQVKAHLARRGALTDSFAHPLLFARSKLRLLTVKRGQVAVNYSSNADGKYYDIYERHRCDEWGFKRDDAAMDPSIWGSDEEDEADCKSDRSSCAASHGPSTSITPSALRTVQTVPEQARRRDGVFALARSVLRLTPALKNLSLTGIFHETLGSDLPIVERLRFVSIGPLCPYLAATYCHAKVPFTGMEKLRVCGDYLGLAVGYHIKGEDGFWPSLREVQWDFGHTLDRTDGFLSQFLNLVQGREIERSDPTRPAAEPKFSKSGRTIAQGQSVGQDDAQSWQQHQRYTDARFPPAIVAEMLSRAPSPETRNAWIHGLPVEDAPHRVRISESRASKTSDPKDRDSDPQDYEVLRQDSQEWWEERALELEREGEEDCSATG